ncbi:hypothetical protein PSTT_05198 [Puccinia striiformis]|uniref:SUN domain-containing protein n=1 Tax=Puccinia striiformis TaxID=27350 RepID=A0A2S4VQ79_9BASI|nr:hypothetical protein PSTT_05198 [Puccinia striiformis]
MFSTDTPVQSKRKSFKAFTAKLINHQQQPVHRVPATQQQQQQPMAEQQEHQEPPLPPSASLILGQTKKINPRLPRPSSSTITLSSVPYSYAYGAAGSPPQQKQAHKGSTSKQATEDNMSLGSQSSDRTSEPAQVRYARLNQRLQNTGSANPPSKLTTTTHLPHDTSTSKQHTQSNTTEYTTTTNTENKKRKKSRRSNIDPSYKYRPGDSDSSDSQAGEGIADKRLRREKKARLESLESQQQQQQEGNSKKSTVSTSKRKSRRKSFGSEDLTDSNEDTGPGIAATRSRRVPKDTHQPTDSNITGNSHLRHDSTSRKNGTSKNKQKNQTDMSEDEEEEEGTETRYEREIDRRSNRPTASFFLSDPEGSQQAEEEQADTRNDEQDLTTRDNTEESSRSALLRLSGDSYDFAEEERIVQALGNQSVNHQDSPSHSNQQSSSTTGDLTRRSDSGIREIQEIIASNNHSHLENQHMPPPPPPPPAPKPEKARVLPLPIPSNQSKSISTDIPEESTQQSFPTKNNTFLNSINDSFKQLSHICSYLLRPDFWVRLTWVILLGSIGSALLINSYKTGDINFPLFSSSRSSPPRYTAPVTTIENMDELIQRLKSLESVVSKISIEQQTDNNNIQRNLNKDKRELDYKLSKIELKLDEEEKIRSKFEDKIHKKFDQNSQVLKTDLDSLRIGHQSDHLQLEKIKENVELISLNKPDSSSINRDEVRRMIEEIWSSSSKSGSSQAGSMDTEKLKQSVTKQVLHHVDQQGYVNKAEIGKLLEDELREMGQGFEFQLDSKLTKIRQELSSSSSSSGRTRKNQIDGSTDLIESVESMITEAIDRYSQDQTGLRDFALYSGGARIIPQLTSPTYSISVTKWSQKLIGFITGAPSVIQGRDPITALSASNELGQCWPFQGHIGQLAIALSRKIKITHFSIQHIHKKIAYEIDSAPREIELWDVDSDRKLADVVYDPNLDNPIQSFEIPDHLNYRDLNNSSGSGSVDEEEEEVGKRDPSGKKEPVLRQALLFKFKSNHGNPFYTCLYRVRVHGLMQSELDL